MSGENPTSVPARAVRDASKAILQKEFWAIFAKPVTFRLDHSSQTLEII